MNRALRHIRRFSGDAILLALVAIVGVSFGACTVTDPEAHTDVADYSWPTTPNTSMAYKKVTYQFNGDSTISESNYIITRQNFDGRSMYRLYDTVASALTSFLFLPAHDTLFVEFDASGSKYALVGPLEKNSTWTAAYFDDAETIPKIRATVLEHYDYKRVDGRTYEDVVAVEYKSLDPNEPNKWIRLYAKGMGEIQTITLTYPQNRPGSPSSQDAVLSERTVLVRTDAARQ